MDETAQRLLISEPKAAIKLSVCPRTMHNLRQDGEIPFVRLRGRVLYSPAALEKWIESKEEGSK